MKHIRIMLHPLAGLVLAASLVACKNKQIDTLAPLEPLVARPLDLNEVHSLSFEGFGLQSQPIAGDTLKVKSVQADNKLEGAYHSLLIRVEADERADYVEFAVCSQTGSPAECNPSKTEPRRFAAATHLYPLAPEGTVGVSVRACVKPEQAQVKDNNCGKWSEALAVQERNADLSLKEQVRLRYEQSQGLVGECEEMRKEMTTYQQEAGEAGDPQVKQLIDNHLQGLTPESCKEMLVDESFQSLSEEMTTVTSVQGQSADKGSAVLIALSSTAIVAGFVAAGVGIWKLQHLNPVTRANSALADAAGKTGRWRALTGLGVLSVIAGVVSLVVDQSLRLDSAPGDKALAKLRAALNERYRRIDGRLQAIRAVTAKIEALEAEKP